MEQTSNPTRDFYNEHAEEWLSRKTNSFYHERQFEKFLKYFDEGDSILDIGCSAGIHVPLFFGIGRKLEYEGLDISRSFLSIARKRYPHLSFLEGDILEADTLPEKKYDGFWAAAVLMHISEELWPKMMANIESIAVPKGVGYITVPQERFSNSESDPRHFTLFDREKFEELVGSRGWRVLESGEQTTANTSSWLWFIVELP